MKKLILAAALLTLVACSRETPSTDTGSQAPTTTETAQQTSTAAASTASTTSAEKPATEYQNKVAELETSAGPIHIRFYPEKAPNHVRNFIDLAAGGFYEGTKFHRVDPNFMIQGGDPNSKAGSPDTWGTGGSEKTVNAEFNDVSHVRGVVSAARTQDPNSASSQFFIVVKDSTFLDGQYSAFGKVVKGLDVVDKIANAARVEGTERPKDPVVVQKITIREAKPEELR